MDDIIQQDKAETKRAKQLRKHEKQQQQQRHDKPLNAHAHVSPPLPPRPKRPFPKRVSADAPADSPSADCDTADTSLSSISTAFVCSRCTFENSGSEACEMCSEPRPMSEKLMWARLEFKCVVCAKHTYGGTKCVWCGATRPELVMEADEESEEGQLRKSKRQKTARHLYSPAARLKPKYRKQQLEAMQQQHSTVNGKSEAAAGKEEADSDLLFDMTADARSIFVRTDWQALHEEVEWIRREAHNEQQHKEREKQIREQQLAALKARYSWGSNIVPPESPPARHEHEQDEKQSYKQEVIEIDMDEKENA